MSEQGSETMPNAQRLSDDDMLRALAETDAPWAEHLSDPSWRRDPSVWHPYDIAVGRHLRCDLGALVRCAAAMGFHFFNLTMRDDGENLVEIFTQRQDEWDEGPYATGPTPESAAIRALYAAKGA